MYVGISRCSEDNSSILFADISNTGKVYLWNKSILHSNGYILKTLAFQDSVDTIQSKAKYALGYTRYYMNSSGKTTDCNLMDIGDVGYTYGNSTTNSPGSGYIVITTGSSENQKVQIGISTTGAGFKTRGYNSANGTWSAWA